MDDQLIRDTMAALDRALAGIAVKVAGGAAGLETLMAALGRGETTAATAAFLSEGAALMRARLLLTPAAPPLRRSLRKAA